MTVIDLGEVTHLDAGPAVPLNHRRLLRALLAVVAVVGVLAVAGSAHGTPISLRPLWIAPFPETGAIALDRHTAYVSRLDDGQQHLIAYDLTTGRQRWSAPTGEAPSDFQPRPAGDTVLVPTDQVTVEREEANGDKYFFVSPGSTVALDTATGKQLWRADGDAQPLVAAGVAIIAEHDKQNGVVGLRLVKLRGGGTIWSLAMPPLVDWTPLPNWAHPEAIATLGRDGSVHVYGFADGRMRTSGRLPGDIAAQPRGAVGLIPAGNDFAVTRSGYESDSVTTVYSAETLRPLWHTGNAGPCGDLICSTGRDGVSGHDPATGRVLWAVQGVTDGWSVGDHRMLVGRRDNTELQLLDSGTGKLIGEPITGMAASDSEPGDSLLITRPSLDPVGQLVVTRLDLADGRQTPLGRFGPSGEQTVCLTAPGYLACGRYDGLHVMAVGP